MPALLHHQPGCFIPATQLFHQSLLLDITVLLQLVTFIRRAAKKKLASTGAQLHKGLGEHGSRWFLPQRHSNLLEEEDKGQGGDTQEPKEGCESSRRNAVSMKRFGRGG